MLGAMAHIVLRLLHETPAWASWLPLWPTCMCEISRDDSVDSVQLFFFFQRFFPIELSCSRREAVTSHQIPEFYVQPSSEIF
jgi:hypothetical protein